MDAVYESQSFGPHCEQQVIALPCSVFVISNVRLHVDGLVHCLSRESALRIVGSGRLDWAMTQLLATPADVVVVDVRGIDDLGLVKQLQQRAPNTKILAFGLSNLDIDAGWMEAGISGFVPPDASREDLVRAICQAARGLFSCSPELTTLLFKRLAAVRANPSSGGELAHQLTAREYDVLLLLERGLSNKEIARKLFIGSATVKNHVHSILNKLRLRRRSEVPSRLTVLRAGDTRSDAALLG